MISTVIAIALIPVAFLFVHAYLSGRRQKSFHKLTGSIAIIWDLSLSIFYMLYRIFGGEVEGEALEIEGALTVYFAVHGLIAVIVILLELTMLSTGIIQWRSGNQIKWHRKLSTPLIILWFITFLSGEIVYVVTYLL